MKKFKIDGKHDRSGSNKNMEPLTNCFCENMLITWRINFVWTETSWSVPHKVASSIDLYPCTSPIRRWRKGRRGSLQPGWEKVQQLILHPHKPKTNRMIRLKSDKKTNAWGNMVKNDAVKWWCMVMSCWRLAAALWLVQLVPLFPWLFAVAGRWITTFDCLQFDVWPSLIGMVHKTIELVSTI